MLLHICNNSDFFFVIYHFPPAVKQKTCLWLIDSSMLFLSFDQESSESANTTIEDEDVRGRKVETVAHKNLQFYRCLVLFILQQHFELCSSFSFSFSWLTLHTHWHSHTVWSVWWLHYQSKVWTQPLNFRSFHSYDCWHCSFSLKAPNLCLKTWNELWRKTMKV